MSSASSTKITDSLRASSKTAHDRSHVVVLTKLAMVLTSQKLYAHALACFYVIFAEIEDQVQRLATSGGQWAELWACIEPISRTAAFRSDLQVTPFQRWMVLR